MTKKSQMISTAKALVVGVVLGVLSFVFGFKSTKIEFDPEMLFCGSCVVDITDLPRFSENEFENYTRGTFQRRDITWIHLFGPTSSYSLYRPVRVYREGERILIFGFAGDESSARELAYREKQDLVHRFSEASNE